MFAINSSAELRVSTSGFIWLKLAAVYLVIGVAMGIMMGASRDFTLRPVHAHVNLLGFATLALSGLIYSVFPKVGESLLARIHFWLMNVSLPVMMVALCFMLKGQVQALPALVVSEFMAAGGVLAFAANLFLNLRK